MMKKSDFIDKHYYSFVKNGHIFYFKNKYINHATYLDYYYEIHIYEGFINYSDICDIYFEIGEKTEHDFKEVNFSEIQPFLPHNHPDIVEYRKNRINKLLSK